MELNEGVRLYRIGFFGKPVGIPKPKPDRNSRSPLILDLMEGLYLLDRRIIRVRCQDHQVIDSRAKLLKLANRTYKQFDLGYTAYENLARERPHRNARYKVRI